MKTNYQRVGRYMNHRVIIADSNVRWYLRTKKDGPVDRPF